MPFITKEEACAFYAIKVAAYNSVVHVQYYQNDIMVLIAALVSIEGSD